VSAAAGAQRRVNVKLGIGIGINDESR